MSTHITLQLGGVWKGSISYPVKRRSGIGDKTRKSATNRLVLMSRHLYIQMFGHLAYRWLSLYEGTNVLSEVGGDGPPDGKSQTGYL
jgi:hypothetical protein